MRQHIFRSVPAWLLLFLVCFQPSNSAGDAKKQQATKEIVVENIQFAIFDRDLNQPGELDLKSLKIGEKLSVKTPLDQQKKLRLSFTVKDRKANAAITVHQAFVLFAHKDSGVETVFVAETDRTTKTYTLDLDMKLHAKEFGGLQGTYEAHLILGDAAATNPLNWHFGDVSLSVPSQYVQPTPKSARINYDVLPSVQHLFREQDPRPPAFVSDTFTVICASPLLLLLILWLRIGINFGNIKFSLWALGFHLGLCAIFGLYACYWLKLNMFQTLKWLAIVGLPTLFCGNRLLHSFATAKKSKSE